MADNKLFLACDCGGMMSLGKRTGLGYFNAPTKEKLEAFYSEHCKPFCVGGRLDNFRTFLEDEDWGKIGG
jgi:hypothetical protein